MRRSFVFLAILLSVRCISYSNYSTHTEAREKIGQVTWEGFKVQWRGVDEVIELEGGFNPPGGSGSYPRHDIKDVYTLLIESGRPISLDSMDTPAEHLKKCGGLISTLTPRCAAELVLWGEFLTHIPFDQSFTPADKLKELGSEYFQLGLQKSAELMSRKETNRVETAKDLAIALGPSPIWMPETMAHPLIQHALSIWNALPASSTRRDVFEAKIRAAEWVRHFFMRAENNQITVDDLRLATPFFKEALAFDALPYPDSADLPDCVEGDLAEGKMKFTGCAYGRFPGERDLTALAVLARTDAVTAIGALSLLVSRGALKENDVAADVEWFTVEGVRRTLAELERWREEARKAGDHASAASTLVEEAENSLGINQPAQAEQNLINAIHEYESIGDKAQVFEAEVNLAALYEKTKQWSKTRETTTRLLALLEENELFGRTDIYDAVQKLHHEAAAGLHLPPDDEAHANEIMRRYAGDTQRLEELKQIAESEYASQARTRTETLVKELDPHTFLGNSIRVTLVGLLAQTGDADRAAALAREIRAENARRFGRAGDIDLLRTLAMIEQRRGAVAEFIRTADELEKLARAASGENWAAPFEAELARGFIEIEEYDRAEALMTAKDKRRLIEKLKTPAPFGDHSEDADLLLHARLLIGRGREKEGMEQVHSIRERALSAFQKTAVQNVKFVEASRAVLDDVAGVEATAGHNDEALAALAPLLTDLDPAVDLETWVGMSIRAGELKMATGADQQPLIDRLEWMAPRIPEFPELDARNAVRMDIFLGRYYRHVNKLDAAKERLERALKVANAMGALDEQIAIHRELGEVAQANHALPVAIDEYRKSVALLESESENIASHTSKIGYRSQRAVAIPLLVAALKEQFDSGDTSRLGDIFTAIEAGKSRALTELVFESAPRKERASNVSLVEVQQHLPVGGRILEYYALGTDVLRLDVTRSAASFVKLDVTNEDIEKGVDSIRALCISGEPFDDASRTETAALTKSLLPTDVYDGSSSEKTLYVIPTGKLHLLPFSVLIGGDGRYLDERDDRHIVYLPNAALLLRQRPRLARGSSSVAYINPALEREQDAYLSADPDLRKTFEETLKRWNGTVVHWQEPTTPAQFIGNAGADNVLLYAHANFLPQDPMTSYVKLSGDGKAAELTAAELLAAPHLGSGLWTLAACRTGEGKLRSGDEVLGLPRALLASGAGMVVVTLWDVDVGSLEAMTMFYGRLASGEGPATALHATRNKLRSDGRPPFDWAPFIIMGFDDFAR